MVGSDGKDYDVKFYANREEKAVYPSPCIVLYEC